MPQGLITTYDLNVGTIVNIEPTIALLDPDDVPILGVGSEGGPFIGRGSDVFEKKYEWLDDTLLTPRCKLNADITNVATSTVLASGDANRFTVGHVIRMDAELVRVTAVASDGITLTLTRGFAATSAAAHTVASGTALIGVGVALPEGSDPGTVRSVDRNNRFNMTQIFGPHPVQTSMTENVIRKYGLQGTTEFNYQAGQRIKENMIELEQALWYGVRYEDTTNKIRTMGGYDYYVVTNVDSTTTAITDSALIALMQGIFDNGGSPKVCVVGSTQKRKISAFESTIIRHESTDGTRGEVVDRYLTDFGTLQVKLDRWIAKTDLKVYDPEQFELQTLRPLQFEMLAKTGDSIKGQIVMEQTAVVRREKHAGRFSALT